MVQTTYVVFHHIILFLLLQDETADYFIRRRISEEVDKTMWLDLSYENMDSEHQGVITDSTNTDRIVPKLKNLVI